MIKRVTLGLIALGVSSVAFAGHPGDDTMLPAATAGVNLTAPHQAGSWSFGVEALYMQAGNNDFHYAQVSEINPASADGFTVQDFTTASVDPDNEWGWRVDATYHFPGNGRDVTLSYTSIDGSESDSTTPALIRSVDDTFLDDTWDAASASSSYDYDSADLTFGQMIHVGQRVYLHPFAGLRWADIDNRDKANYLFVTTGGNGLGTETLSGRFSSSFNGIGPRFGTDAQVNIGSGWSFRGRVGVSLLVGDFDKSARVVLASFTDTTPSALGSSLTENFKSDSETRVVPEMDARLGVNWGMNLNNGTGVSFEVGYEVTDYFDAVDNSFVSYGDTSDHNSDFSLHGPYLRLQLDLA